MEDVRDMGHILQTMLSKIDHDMPIQTYTELQRPLVQCTHAKNFLSIRKGFSPEVAGVWEKFEIAWIFGKL